MSVIEQVNGVHSNIKEAMQSLVQAQMQVLQVSQQGNQAFAAALMQLADAIAAPRQLVTDSTGRPVGVTRVQQQIGV